MDKDNFEKPILAENPTDTTVINVGEEITDNAVQNAEMREQTVAEYVEDTEMTDSLANPELNETVDLNADIIKDNNIIVSSATERATSNVTDNTGSYYNDFDDEVEFDTDDDDESIEERTARTLSPGRLVLKRFFRSKLSMAGLVILVILFIFSFFGPLFDTLPFIWGEREPDKSQSVREEYTEGVNVKSNGQYSVYDKSENGSNTVYIVTYSYPSNYLKPSEKHLLGTDDKGYDIFSRLMYGGRISLTLGFVVIILETVIGVILGGLAGYFGKWVDQLIMRIVDIFNCVPNLPMLMIVGVALERLEIYGPSRLYILMAFMTLFGWAGTARLVRGQILSLREQDFMLSAEASGLTVGRKIFKHLIPNVIPQLIVSMTLGLGGIILTEATLGYFGIGLPAEYATWGNMINAAANNTTLTLYPNLWISPGICIVLAVLGFNFVGDGLRDAFDPKARR